MKTLSFFLIYLRAMIATNLKAALALRASFLTGAAMMMLNNIFFIVNWVIFFDHFEAIRGWDLNDMFVLYGIASTGFGICVFFVGGSRELARLIDDGNLDTWLVQPKPVLASALGSYCHATGLGDIIAGIAFLAYAGVLTSVGNIVLIAIVLTVSAFVYLGLSIMAHSLAFWMGRTYQLSRSIQEFLILFGLYPGGIHQPWAKVMLYLVIPAGLFGWMPVELVQDFDLGQGLIFLGGAVAYFCVSLLVFRLGLRRYTSGSRFGVVA